MSTSRIRPTSASIMVRLRQTRPVPDSFGLWRHDELSRRQVEVVSTLPFLETRVNLSRGGFASDKERLERLVCQEDPCGDAQRFRAEDRLLPVSLLYSMSVGGNSGYVRAGLSFTSAVTARYTVPM